jgi:sugar phosphate isomerase/epimerase
MTDLPAIDLVLHTYGFRFALTLDPAFDVFAFLDRAVAGGFGTVAINCNGPRYRFLGGDSPEHVAAVRRGLDERRLGVDIETSGTAPAHLGDLLALATTLGATYLRTYTRHLGPREEVIAATIRDLREAAPRAEAAGVPILLENHEEFTGVEIARVLDAVDSPWVGALYDYGNSMMLREDPLDGLTAMLPWVRKSHLKDHVVIAAADSPTGEPLIAGVPLGLGNLALVETTRRLLAAGATRIAFENVWAYAAPLHARQDGRPAEALGTGVFSYARPPWPEALWVPDVASLARADPARVVALEAAAFGRAQQHLLTSLAAAGMQIA